MPDGTGYVKLLDFAGATNGSYPYGDLISDGTFLYGMTRYGGTNNLGVIFKLGMTTGITETNSEPEFAIFPNPTTGIINISSSIVGVQQVSITNMLGEVVSSKEINLVAGSPFTIDITHEPAGIYLLRLGSVSQRIVKRQVKIKKPE